MPWKEPADRSASPRALVHAKILRRTQTDAEKRLWRHLRDRLPVDGSHFRRQVALGPYVADFCCLSARLIVEIDGSQHGLDRAVRYDATRTTALEQQGFRVLRFTNADVMQRIDSVLDTILAAITADPSDTRQNGGATLNPGPSPSGRGEQEPAHGRHL
ncbi:endonuclease domain-containing protein [Methylobacterium sp. Leaf113]|uniref:endonuclease domain-containing protein n=1 Tax=Methylobacterium sp. Leaf113 TaxID=1736259 RepID=UPI0009E97367|nr:DUF559 domain-containing protein [Methylobacterium sp. Leaf113]